ncbi:hypothetical protein SLG_04420 [Sphingobium sp. SYK-6]|nr:hypothetical protein SLG_04420 [Sphingobium sp. SYK-6]
MIPRPGSSPASASPDGTGEAEPWRKIATGRETCGHVGMAAGPPAIATPWRSIMFTYLKG